MPITEIAKLRRTSQLKKFGLMWFHKYATAILLFFVTYCAKEMKSRWFYENFHWMVEFGGFGIFLIVWLAIDGYRNGKCVWFHASLVGLFWDCVINLMYQPTYSGAYFYEFKYYPLLFSSGFVISLIVYDEYSGYVYKFYSRVNIFFTFCLAVVFMWIDKLRWKINLRRYNPHFCHG